MLIEVEFRVGEQIIGRARWPYLPPPGMTLLLELPGGGRLFRVFDTCGTGVVRAGQQQVGPHPTLLPRAVRVQLGDITDLAGVDSPGDMPGPGPAR